MKVLRYRFEALRSDYLRTGIGLALSLGPALFIPAGSAAMYLLGPAGLLFLIFGLRTWRRQISRAEVDGDGISFFSPGRVSLAWNDLRAIKLSYYSTRTDRTGGWMQLTLRGENGKPAIRLDSSLDDFEHVARLAAAAARHHGIAVTAATQSNFSALGIDSETPTPHPDEAA
jgi:hypothetical protein